MSEHRDMELRELTAHQAARAAFNRAAEAAGTLEHADPQTREEMQRLEQGATIVESPPEPVVEVPRLPDAETSDAERKLWAWCDANGEQPNPKIIAKMRSGDWQARQRQNLQKLRQTQTRLALLRRDGYTFDREHRLVAPALTRIHAPAPLDNVSRPRERRPRRSSTSSRGSPDSEPEPPLRVIPPAEFRRLLRALGAA